MTHENCVQFLAILALYDALLGNFDFFGTIIAITHYLVIQKSHFIKIRHFSVPVFEVYFGQNNNTLFFEIMRWGGELLKSEISQTVYGKSEGIAKTVDVVKCMFWFHSLQQHSIVTFISTPSSVQSIALHHFHLQLCFSFK